MSTATTASDAIRQARTRLQARDPRGAVEALKAAISQGERTAELMELLGVSLGMAGNMSGSRVAFEEATKLEPNRATAHYNYAIVLSRDGELERAAEEADTAVFIDPKHEGASRLREQIVQQLRDRRLIGEEPFQTVGRAPSPDALNSSVVTQLKCTVCGKMNVFHARVCRHCGTFIKEMPDVEIVE